MGIKNLGLILVSALLLSGSPSVNAVRYTLKDFLEASNNYRARESSENLQALLQVYDNLNQYYKLGADRELKNSFDTTAEELAMRSAEHSVVPVSVQTEVEYLTVMPDTLQDGEIALALAESQNTLMQDNDELSIALEQSLQSKEEYDVARAVEESFLEAQELEYLILKEKHDFAKAVELSLDDLIEQTKQESLREQAQIQVPREAVVPAMVMPIEEVVLPVVEFRENSRTNQIVAPVDQPRELEQQAPAVVVPVIQNQLLAPVVPENAEDRFERTKRIIAELTINPRVQYVVRSDELDENAVTFDEAMQTVSRALADDPGNKNLRLLLMLMDGINQKIQTYIATKIAEDIGSPHIETIQKSIANNGFIENKYVRNKAKIKPNQVIQDGAFKNSIQEFIDTFLTNEIIGKWLNVQSKWTHYLSLSNDQYYVDTYGLDAINRYLSFIEHMGRIILSSDSIDQKRHDLDCLEEDFADCINHDPTILGYFDTYKESFGSKK